MTPSKKVWVDEPVCAFHRACIQQEPHVFLDQGEYFPVIADDAAMHFESHRRSMTIAKVAFGMALAAVWWIYLFFLRLFILDASEFGFHTVRLGVDDPAVHPGFAIAYLLMGALLVVETFMVFFAPRSGD